MEETKRLELMVENVGLHQCCKNNKNVDRGGLLRRFSLVAQVRFGVPPRGDVLRFGIWQSTKEDCAGGTRLLRLRLAKLFFDFGFGAGFVAFEVGFFNNLA